MPNVWIAFAITHLVNIVGVICTYKLSKQYLGHYIQTSEKFKPHIASINQTVEDYGIDSAIYAMISMRLLPGSPNAIYNVVLPHIDSLHLGHVLAGVVIGQAPYNMSVAKAGQILSTIKSKSDIVSKETSLALLGLAFVFLLPVLIKWNQKKKVKSN